MLIEWVLRGINFLWKRNKDDPFPIGRDVREPVVVFIESDLFLMATIRFHAPEFHGAGAHGIKINILAVGGILRAIIECWTLCKRCFLFGGDINSPDIKNFVALSGEYQGLLVGRPAV